MWCFIFSLSSPIGPFLPRLGNPSFLDGLCYSRIDEAQRLVGCFVKIRKNKEKS